MVKGNRKEGRKEGWMDGWMEVSTSVAEVKRIKWQRKGIPDTKKAL